jgi:hypothetical protein
MPFIVEAPLNSVEFLEAILQPPEPLEVHKLPHIHRTRATKAKKRPGRLPTLQRLYDEFTQFQGRLTEDRDIPVTFVPDGSLDILRKRFRGSLWPVQLHYISIMVRLDCVGGRVALWHPWALVFHHRPLPQYGFTYESLLKTLLAELGIPDCDFKRSLLKSGTTPIPECLWDWIAGLPGKTVALPYLISEAKEEPENWDEESKNKSRRNDKSPR